MFGCKRPGKRILGTLGKNIFFGIIQRRNDKLITVLSLPGQRRLWNLILLILRNILTMLAKGREEI